MELIIVIAFKQKLHLNFYHLYNSICVLSKISTKTIYILRCNWHLSQYSCSVVSDSLQPHGLQHAGLPCPSPCPRACSNSCPSSQWCHPTISSSVIHFSSCLQSFLASGSFQMSQFFISGGQIVGVSASASVLPMNIQDWIFLGWTDWSSCSLRDSQESSPTPQFKTINSLALSFLYSSTLTSVTWLLEKPQLWLDGPLLAKPCLCFLICCLG